MCGGERGGAFIVMVKALAGGSMVIRVDFALFDFLSGPNPSSPESGR